MLPLPASWRRSIRRANLVQPRKLALESLEDRVVPVFTGGVFTAIGDVNGDGFLDLITGPGAGGGPHVKVFSGADGQLLRTFFAFDPSFSGGVNVAAGDLNGDGRAEIVVGAGPGGGPQVTVFDGTTGDIILSFFAYADTLRGGVHVALGDVDGDNQPEIIVGAGVGGGAHVRVFDALTGTEVLGFFAYDPTVRGGVEVGAGDLTGDGKAEIVTGPGPGGGPHVKVFDGATGRELLGFMPYSPEFRGGVTLTVGDVTGDGHPEVITAAGPGGAPHVVATDPFSGNVALSFFAYDPSFPGGVHLAAADLDWDGRSELVTGPGPGGGPHVRVLRPDASEITSFFAYDPETFPTGFAKQRPDNVIPPVVPPPPGPVPPPVPDQTTKKSPLGPMATVGAPWP